MPPVPYQWISDLLKAGDVVPFLGAGASLIGTLTSAWKFPGADRLPTGIELRNYLARLASLAFEDPGGPDLATVAQYCSFAVGRPDLRECLHAIFADKYPFGELHRYLASLPYPLLVMTTNYDNLLERAFSEGGKPFDLVVHQTSDLAHAGQVAYWPHDGSGPYYEKPNRLDVDLERVSVIYKMHGTVTSADASQDSFLITEDDYVDFLVNMESTTPIPSRIKEEFTQRHFLFLGYGLADWNFRVVLGTLRQALAQRKSWAIKYQTSALEEAIWTSRGVLIFDMTVDEFVRQLQQASP
jgi:hypothetical protein